MTTGKEPLTRRYLTGLESAVSGNAQAFGYSILITVTYGVVSAAYGNPSRLELLGFALAAVASLSLLNLVIAVLNRQFPAKPTSTRIVLIATATDFLAVGLGVGAAVGVTSELGGWPVWPVAPAVAGLLYVLIQGLEFALGRASSEDAQE